MEWLLTLEYWHWWVLALALIIFEVMGAAGFFLGAAAAAFITGILSAVVGPVWEVQLTCFGVLTLILTWVYFKRFRNFNQQTDNEQLNTVEHRLMGRYAKVLKPISSHEVKIQLGDTLWTATTDGESFSEGDEVEIVAVNDNVPHVKAK